MVTAAVDEALVERGAQELFAHVHPRAEWETEVEEYKNLVRLEAKSVLAAVLPDVRAQALRDAADDWQMGRWADAPRRADPVRERLANAQHVCDWLRARAAREAGERAPERSP